MSSEKSWVLERRGGGRWSVMHRATELRISVMRPYPGQEILPPIEVATFGSRKEAERAAAEIDWAWVDEQARQPAIQEQAARWREKKRADASYQVALERARQGLEPWPWEHGGILHRGSQEIARPDEEAQLDFGLIT